MKRDQMKYMSEKVEELVKYIKKNGDGAIVTKNPKCKIENVKRNILDQSTKEDIAEMVNAFWTSDFKRLLKKNKLCVAQKHILQVECPILRKQLQKHPEQEEDQEAANKEEVNDGENQVEIAEEEETRREPQKHFSEEIVKEKEAQIPDWPREEEVEMTRLNLRRRESTIYDFAPSDSEEDLSSGEDSDIFDPKGEEETDFEDTILTNKDLNTPQKRNRESSDEEMIPGSPIYLSPQPHVAGSRSSKYFEPSMKKLKELDPLQNASAVSNSLQLKPQEQIDTEEPAKKKIEHTKTATVSNSLQQLAQEELVSNQNVSETSYKDNPDHFSQPTDLEKLSSSRIVQEKEDQYSQPLEIVEDTSEKEKEKASYNIFYSEVRMCQTFDISSFYHNISSSLLFY